MRTVIRNGGIAPGGFNFDAKLRRESTTVEDLVAAHVSGIDALARALRSAASLDEKGDLDTMVKQRYASYDSSQLGRYIESGDAEFETLERAALEFEEGEVQLQSGRQEIMERIVALEL